MSTFKHHPSWIYKDTSQADGQADNTKFNLEPSQLPLDVALHDISTLNSMNLVSHVSHPQPIHYPASQVLLQPVQSVYEIVRIYPNVNQLVPQKMYHPITQSNIKEVQLEQPIMFFITSPNNLGLSCCDTLNSCLTHLHDRDDQMFTNCGPSVSICVQVCLNFGFLPIQSIRHS